ncbi:hypothetical protein MMC13_000805 [Lambiella insularis]|nr:hypothetical protein [Lambiella insularis]
MSATGGFDILLDPEAIAREQSKLEYAFKKSFGAEACLASSSEQAKTAVVTSRGSPGTGSYMGTHVFRSYDHIAVGDPRQFLFTTGKCGNVKIWEAARATLVVPARAPRFEFKGDDYVGESGSQRNPTRLAVEEVRSMTRTTKDFIDLFRAVVSIGHDSLSTDDPAALNRTPNSVDPEAVHRVVLDHFKRGPPYYRFNVSKGYHITGGVNHISLDDWPPSCLPSGAYADYIALTKVLDKPVDQDLRGYTGFPGEYLAVAWSGSKGFEHSTRNAGHASAWIGSSSSLLQNDALAPYSS